MRKSNYTFAVVAGVLCIEDLGPHDQYVTVTNNAEGVLEEVKGQLGMDMPEIVIYRDSEGTWDGMEYRHDRLEFYPLQTQDRQAAVNEAAARWNRAAKHKS